MTALIEEMLIIRGPIENCVNATREILKLVRAELEAKSLTSDIPLKLVVHNDYIGRVIGKQGKMIFTIKTESDTVLSISNVKDTSSDVERIITVKGELENVLKALELIHAKVQLIDIFSVSVYYTFHV
jgi:predicted RNA-binding protein YlqC (UPF0109 family)